MSSKSLCSIDNEFVANTWHLALVAGMASNVAMQRDKNLKLQIWFCLEQTMIKTHS